MKSLKFVLWYYQIQNILLHNVRSLPSLDLIKHSSILCHIPQLSKGIEFIKILNEWNHSNIPIYIDESMMKIITKMERLSIPILTTCNKVMGDTIPRKPHIYVTNTAFYQGYGYYKNVNV